MAPHPLVIDLDGTLIHTDMLHESALHVLRNHPLDALCIPMWLARGKAALKQKLAARSNLDPSALPYNLELLTWLKAQKTQGRTLILCTASDHSIATAIAKHLDIFDEVMASNGDTNLAGANKAKALEARFGRAGFDYAGNSTADIAVWKTARNAIVVNASSQLTAAAAQCCTVEQVFPPPTTNVKTWLRMLRVHQWLKNLLLFVPFFAAHMLSNTQAWLSLALAFCAFSLCASSVYIANDLLDLESDRQHPRKRNRPFASGALPVWVGVVTAPPLLLCSLFLAQHVSAGFMLWLSLYFALTCAYSWSLKRLMLIDCLSLAVLYTLRIIAGAAAINMQLSFWLLAFAIFLFLSLAFVKRYAELEVQLSNGKQKAHGRGYYTSDASIIQSLGITSSYASVLVLALYLNSDAVVKLYRTPEAIWAAVPVMLFWVSWMWMQAHRGLMHDDPLVFAIKDKASLLAGLAFAAILALGTVGWSW